MIKVSVEKVTKSFGALRAVDEVSLETCGGEVFALLGPNGAGKTTLIRMIMDIMRPDSGTITFDGSPISYELKHRTGYLPEERGLYKKQILGEVVAFFGQLHGLSRDEARARAHDWLARVDLADWEKKKVEELSKGMQQKAQLAITLLHDPDLVILDEPFAGLDPLNTKMVKDFILEMKNRRKTVLLSTHQMAHVEALADHVFMISHGRRVLYGTLQDIKKDYSDNAVMVNEEVDTKDFEGVTRVDAEAAPGKLQKVWLQSNVEPGAFLRELLDREEPVEHYELAETPLEDIFVRLAKRPEAEEVAS